MVKYDSYSTGVLKRTLRYARKRVAHYEGLIKRHAEGSALYQRAKQELERYRYQVEEATRVLKERGEL